MKIGDFEATLMHARVGDTTVALWRVAELARHVDRAALLAADEAPEPPYWAHLWSGAVVLATDRAAGRAPRARAGLRRRAPRLDGRAPRGAGHVRRPRARGARLRARERTGERARGGRPGGRRRDRARARSPLRPRARGGARLRPGRLPG